MKISKLIIYHIFMSSMKIIVLKVMNIIILYKVQSKINYDNFFFTMKPASFSSITIYNFVETKQLFVFMAYILMFDYN